MTVNQLISIAPGFPHQVKVVRYGRQTVSVDVDAGVLLFDRKPGLLGVERVSHDRSKNKFKVYHFSYLCLLSVTRLSAFFLLLSTTLGCVFVLTVKGQVRSCVQHLSNLSFNMSKLLSNIKNINCNVSHLSVLQVVKFQNSPAKIRMVVDSYQNTPREMTFESARVR